MAGPTELVFVPLGGVGEIGMNFGLYGYGPANNRRWIVVDCGVSFPGPDLPGIDIVFPEVTFIEEQRDRLLGIVITHAHEDHYGALTTLWPKLRAQIYATAFTAGLLEAKRGNGGTELPVTEVRAGQRIQLGPFEVEFISVAHSIPEAMALAIRTEAGTVVHTGDWKIDKDPQVGPPTNENRLREIGEEGVLALVCDSTNAARTGHSPSEGAVARELTTLVAEARGRVAFTLFASNVARLRSIALAARAAGREVVAVGRAIRRVVEVATELGYLRDAPPFREADTLEHLPAGNVVLILSGSQGEPRAALARVAAGEDRLVRLGPGDVMVFSSRTIPGNERPVIDIQNRLIAAGVEVITDRDRLVHVSGHPRREELLEMYNWVRPQILVPVHGEAAHLAAQAELGRAAGIKSVLRLEDGGIARLSPDPTVFPSAVPVGRIYRDGTIVGDRDELGISERRRMAFAGHVSVFVLLDHRGELEHAPQCILAGVPIRTADGKPMAGLVNRAVVGALSSIPRPRRRDPELVMDAVRRSVRAAIADVWDKKPICTVHVAVIE
ncbi:MAG: ribonuclease J [Bauldia sp.]